nr:MAG TPA: hypothetical protein [Caudoviricetes sp.]
MGVLIYYLSHSLSSCCLPLAYPPLAGFLGPIFYILRHKTPGM